MYPVECVVRGYLSGSGWREYQRDGAVCGIELPAGLTRVRQAAGADLHPGDQGRARRARREHRLRPRRRDHRRPAADGGAAADLDRDLRARRRARGRARDHRRRHQVRVRQLTPAPRSSSATRCCTPDSSRFWPADGYEPGRSQASFDKQYVRDCADSVGWDHTAAGAGASRRGRPEHPGASTSRPTSGSPTGARRCAGAEAQPVSGAGPAARLGT